MDWEGHRRSYQEAAREDLIQATKVGESQVKVIQESVRDRSVEKSDLSDQVNHLQECLSPNSTSSDDLLSSEDDSKDTLIEWFYVKRGVKQGTMEIVYTSLPDLEGHVNYETYQGLELVQAANEEDGQDSEVETENVCEEDLLNKTVEREDTKMEYSQAKVMNDGDTKYCQDTSLPGKDELKQTKERKSLEEVNGRKHNMCNFLKNKSEDRPLNYISDHHNNLAFCCFPSNVSLPKLSVESSPTKSIECFKGQNLSCNSMTGMNIKAALEEKSVSSVSGVPIKLVLNRPKKKSSQRLSNEALEIFSASTEPVTKKPIFNKKDCGEQLLCTECGKCFCLKNQLEKHMKVHKKPTIDVKVNEKNVLCTVCDKCFLRKNHLESHMRNIHKSKLLACKIGDCGMAFCDKRLFHIHKLKAHNILV